MNAELKQIQATLKTIGLYTGAIDGLIGNKTYSAFVKLKEYKGSKQPLRDIQTILATARVYFGAIDGIIGNGSISAFNHLMPAPKVTDELLKKSIKTVHLVLLITLTRISPHTTSKPRPILCFLANNIHESNGFTKLRENMNYSPNAFWKFSRNTSKALLQQQPLRTVGQWLSLTPFMVGVWGIIQIMMTALTIVAVAPFI
jgi:peptidoglycan hydrolase-like protein with peptidoglycan-binding domain